MPRVDDEEKGGRGCRAWAIEEKWATGGTSASFSDKNDFGASEAHHGHYLLGLLLVAFRKM